MAYKKKNGDLDMRYNSSKRKVKSISMWTTIGMIILIILVITGVIK